MFLEKNKLATIERNIKRVEDFQQDNEHFLKEFDIKFGDRIHIIDDNPVFTSRGVNHLLKCIKCKNQYIRKIYYPSMMQWCPMCPDCGVRREFNQFEIQIQEFLDSLGVRYSINEKKIIPPYEIDFYLPDYQLGIECDGLYFHREQIRGKSYHLDKTNLCRDNNIRLIHIFEDEMLKDGIVKSRLANILGFSKNRLGARKCRISQVSQKEKASFLKLNHIQGNDNSSFAYGLYKDDVLLSIMTFSKPRACIGRAGSQHGEFELVRFASEKDYVIAGAASRLFNYFIKNHNPVKVVTYCDYRWSEGTVYSHLGFSHVHDSKPNFWYFKNRLRRYHRFGFTKNRLERLEIFDSNLTAFENMDINGWYRIWDCGNGVFEWTS
jgi:very-short-patch-repair endonuclease